MSLPDSKTCLAVDGGGSNCRFALRHGARSYMAKLGPANFSTDADGAIATLLAGLKDVADKAGVSLGDLREIPTYIGLSGIVETTDAEVVARALPLEVLYVEDDRAAAVRGALGGTTGTVAGLGTGSFLARQTPKGLRRVGGWGFRLADQASGAWIGRELLARTLEVHDGLRAATPLSRDVFSDFANSPKRIVDFSLASAAQDFGSLAPKVVTAAGVDSLAAEILTDGAAFIERTARALGWKPSEPLCLIGGVAPAYPDFLPAEMARSLVPPLGSALDGALQLAMELPAKSEELHP